MKQLGIGALLVMCGVAAVAGPLAAQVPLVKRPPQAPTVRATPRASFVLDSASIMARGPMFVAHARALTYDTSVTGCDRRVLMERRADSGLYVGPKAELAPEIGAALVSGPWKDEGRVVARITLYGNAAYRSGYTLQPGITYLVVRRLAARSDSLTGFLVATGHGNTVLAVERVLVGTMPGTGPARFILAPQDDKICTPCNSTMCCPVGQ